MKKKILRITEQELHRQAESIFIKACGFDLSKEKDRRMMATARAVWSQEYEGREFPAIIGSFGADTFADGIVDLGDGPISCNIFEGIPEDAVSEVYAFTLTAGEYSIDSDSDMMGYVYADIWGTSYVEAASEYVKAIIGSGLSSGLSLSPEFGPGYFGIPVENTRKLADILRADDIGIQVNDGGLLIPQKSCASIMFAFHDFQLDAPAACVTCQGAKGGCKFCNITKK